MQAILPPRGRDLRLDFLRGVANWAIFLDHIPHNAVNWITTRNYGFSDAADLFVFISGYTVAFVYARMMLERGFIAGGTRIIKRAWQIYVAHVFLFVIYLAEIGWLAQRYGRPQLLDEFNIHGFLKAPAEWLFEGLMLKFKPVNMDVLPLYIVLMAVFPPILWAMLRRPNTVLAGSVVLYLAARQFGWNLPSYPAGSWYFNPFCWQLLFVFGAWFALGGARSTREIATSRWSLAFGIAFLIFALVITLADRFPGLKELLPPWLMSTFHHWDDKTDLAPYRFLHFVVIAYMVVRFVPREAPWLQWRIFHPLVLCGQQSLEVFCTGIFLSAAAHFILVQVTGAFWMQVVVSVAGIALMTFVAWYRSWSKRMDKAPRPPVPAPAVPVPAAGVTT